MSADPELLNQVYRDGSYPKLYSHNEKIEKQKAS